MVAAAIVFVVVLTAAVVATVFVFGLVEINVPLLFPLIVEPYVFKPLVNFLLLIDHETLPSNVSTASLTDDAFARSRSMQMSRSTTSLP